MKRLKKFQVTSMLWNQLLDSYKPLIKEMSYQDFEFGNLDKIHVLVDFRTRTLCVNEIILSEMDRKYKRVYPRRMTYQVILESNDELGVSEIHKAESEFSPWKAKMTMKKELKKVYTDEEVIRRLDMFKKDKFEQQLHFTNTEANKILKFENCKYYDLNGAHTYLLSIIFPKLKTTLEYWNAHKHDEGKSYYKAIPNMYVGTLGMWANKEKTIEGRHRKTYNWIVSQVNRLMEDAFAKTYGGLTSKSNYVYINTDGFIMQHPVKELETSRELGKFKEEFSGDVYSYQGDNYWIIQYGDIIKGSLPKELRKYVDLREGRVVSYNTKVIDKIYYYENIKEIKINEIKRIK